MSRTVTALYDSRAEAEEARARLSSRVNADVDVIDQLAQSRTRDYDIAEDDRHAYGEGLRRGGYLLCARVATGESADQIVSILEESAGVDLDERQQAWQKEGWAPYGERGEGTQSAAATGAQAQQTVEEERIPVIEEQLRVGKREVARGGARVRSYVREVPVHEQVELREEHVSIERRPVEERLSEADLQSSGILQERVVEVSEFKEEAVVNKEAVIREELVVKKTVEQHSEQIDETVRRTEVEVQDLSNSDERSAFGGFDSDDANAPRASGSEYERSDRQG